MTYQDIKILAIIPSRKGSKGIKNKNTKTLAGRPLIAYTIESAKKSKFIDKLILSSDDERAIEIAKKNQIEVPFIRPKKLSKDSSGSLEVVQHAIKFFENQNQYFDAVLLLQPTTPFRNSKLIDKAIEKFIKDKCDALISVFTVPHRYNPHWVFEPNGEGYLKISTGDQNIIKRRQDLPKAYFRDGSIYITKTEILKNGSFFGNKLSYIESDPTKQVNIDTKEDWKIAEKIAKSLNKNG